VQTIQAHVSARILNKADRLFTNRLSQVFAELLQNARRAGASLVSVTTNPEPPPEPLALPSRTMAPASTTSANCSTWESRVG